MNSDRRLLEMKIALIFTKGITPELVKIFPEAGIDVEDFFSIPISQLKDALSIRGKWEIDAYQRGEAINLARKELEFIDRHSIRVIYMHDEDYPWRLLELHNPPVVLFCLGDADLNSDHNVSMVGTRRCTQGGMDFCKSFVSELSPLFPDLCIVSGLAYGIDAASHAAAIQNRRPTVAVLAHGLDTIYPAAHRNLARAILAEGGALLSEYPSGTTPFRGNFLERNRIVAGLSDSVIVVESEVKGGAMATANIAFSNNREVFAVPGRPTDTMSSGCNHLIQKSKARLLTGVTEFIQELDWRPAGVKLEPSQRNLFPELEGNAKIIYDYVRFQREPCTIDAIHNATALPVASVMAALGELELDGIVVRLPGNRYEIAG